MSRYERFTAKREYLNHAAAARIDYDCECDLCDVWNEYADPENEFGDICVGLFQIDREGDYVHHATLSGVRVSYGRDPEAEFDRALVLRLMGGERVSALEEMQADDLNQPTKY